MMCSVRPARRRGHTWFMASLVAAAVTLTGCGATVYERHYFAAYKSSPDGAREPVQFYRLTVSGNTQLSNARYLTGYFDERAISLFFNEIKAPVNQKLFDETVKLPGAAADMKLTPLSPSAENGAFVMIMSTNADAVAGTIGSFAESQAVADALTNMLNRDRILAKSRSDANLAVQKAEGAALYAQLEAQVKAASASEKGERSAAQYVQALTTLARSLGYTGDDFHRVVEARSWFNLESARVGGMP